MKDGIININKPQGMTSNDVLYKVRSILGIKKLGHTGTLDPLATGVLPICINRATRIAEYMDVDFKTYRSVMVLGKTTDTQDITGEVLSECDSSFVTEEAIRDAFKPFDGLIEQFPPMYSAVRINGRKLYTYMYGGDEKEIEAIRKKVKSRQVYIRGIEIEEISGLGTAHPVITYTVECSKGTYIRTICQDVGQALKCGATMTSLERTQSGVFTVENAVSLDKLKEIAKEVGILNSEGFSVDKSFHEDIPSVFEKYVVPCDYPLEHFGKVIVSRELGEKFVDGWHLGYDEIEIVERPNYEKPVEKSCLRDANPDSQSKHHGSYPGLKVHPEYENAYKIYWEDGTFLGVAFHSDKYHKLVADKVFYRKDF